MPESPSWSVSHRGDCDVIGTVPTKYRTVAHIHPAVSIASNALSLERKLSSDKYIIGFYDKLNCFHVGLEAAFNWKCRIDKYSQVITNTTLVFCFKQRQQIGRLSKEIPKSKKFLYNLRLIANSTCYLHYIYTIETTENQKNFFPLHEVFSFLQNRCADSADSKIIPQILVSNLSFWSTRNLILVLSCYEMIN